MPRRIDVDEDLEPVEIPRGILSGLYQHALEALPEECCGLLLGTERERFRQIVRCHNDMTSLHRRDPAAHPRDGQAAFYMRESDYLQAMKEAEAARHRITAVYHSHVDAGAYLSELDLEYAEQALFPFPSADHIVVSVGRDRTVKGAALFQRTFVGRRIAPAAP